MRYAELVEGKTKLLVPPASLKAQAPPKSPVFFNPVASVNRDVSVAVALAAGGSTFCDSMAGVGARGVRVAKEVERTRKVSLVDFNAEALGVARRTAALNGVLGRCEFEVGETSSVLFSRYGKDEKFDSVDVDPFGSPMRQVQAGVSATRDGGILSVTATDTAALCGVYPRVAMRRYGAATVNNHFHHETGIRILVNAIRRVAASVEVGVSPVAAHATRHYIRVFVRLAVGPSKADSSLGHEGFVAWCPYCGDTSSSSDRLLVCPECGRAPKVAGPLWVGNLTDRRLMVRAAGAAEDGGLIRAAKILRSLDEVDLFPPLSYSIERICSSLGIATVPEADVRKFLSKAGYDSCRQPFEDTGLKTRATFKDVKDAVRASARA